MKIYTKKGDRGETGLLGGARVPKHHIRIEAYGTIDELNAHIGHLRDNIPDGELRDQLLDIQNELFTIGSHLATIPGSKVKLPELPEDCILRLERSIDGMESELPELKAFIIPSGHPVVSLCHIARTVCRRAERNIVHLAETESIDEVMIAYINRLSDALFVMSRKLAKDNGVGDVEWAP